MYRQKHKFTDFSEISDFSEFLWVFRKKAVLGENREIFVKEVFFVDFCLELEDFWVLEVNLKIFVVFEIFGFGGNLKILKGFCMKVKVSWFEFKTLNF